jgi:translation initiation factor 2 subunit 1
MEFSNVPSISVVRMYEKKVPTTDEHVIIEIKYVDDISTKVVLPEYENKEALMLHSNALMGRFSRTKRQARVGHIDVAVVLTIDSQRGFIDVSKRHTYKPSVDECLKRYHKSKAARNILNIVSSKTHVDLLQLYENIGWPLTKIYDHTLDGFFAIRDNLFDWSCIGNIDAIVRETLTCVIHQKLNLKQEKFRSQIAVNCCTIEGIDAIRDALSAGKKHNPEVTIQYVGGLGEQDKRTSYKVEIQHTDKQKGICILEEVQKIIEKTILSLGGSFEVLRLPTCVSLTDEIEFQSQMHNALKEIRQVDGDLSECCHHV